MIQNLPFEFQRCENSFKKLSTFNSSTNALKNKNWVLVL